MPALGPTASSRPGAPSPEQQPLAGVSFPSLRGKGRHRQPCLQAETRGQRGASLSRSQGLSGPSGPRGLPATRGLALSAHEGDSHAQPVFRVAGPHPSAGVETVTGTHLLAP